jgi:hypothetical protein
MERTPQWSEPSDVAQSRVGGVIATLSSMAQLCQDKSRVLGRSLPVPLLVISPGTVWREKVCVAAHCSKRGELVDLSQEEGDQEREWRLKSPIRSVGTVGSRSKERRVFSDVVSSTSL